MPDQIRVAIVGAGITGLQLARRLSSVADVSIFEKSRGLGGRMSTRRAGAFHFDHGAQYFTARTSAFQNFLSPFLDSGVVARWTPRLMNLSGGEPVVWDTARYVAVPGMNALAKAMTTNLNIIPKTRITGLAKSNGQWWLAAAQGETYGGFDWIIITAPAEQSVQLLPEALDIRKSVEGARMQGCYSLMIGYTTPQSLSWDAATLGSGPLSWIALNHSKPGRPDGFSVVCHSSNDWADTHLEADQKNVEDALFEAFEAVTGLSAGAADYKSLHRWRYAKMSRPAGAPFLADKANQLACAGDWCGDGRVETGFASANALADFLYETL